MNRHPLTILALSIIVAGAIGDTVRDRLVVAGWPTLTALALGVVVACAPFLLAHLWRDQ